MEKVEKVPTCDSSISGIGLLIYQHIWQSILSTYDNSCTLLIMFWCNAPSSFSYVFIFSYQVALWSSQNKASSSNPSHAKYICLLVHNVHRNPPNMQKFHYSFCTITVHDRITKDCHGLTKVIDLIGAKMPKMVNLSRNFMEDNIGNVTRLCKRDQHAILSRENLKAKRISGRFGAKSKT